MRLISAEALHEALKTKQKWVVRCGDKHNEGYTYDQVHFAIDEAPTIDADRPQGKWIKFGLGRGTRILFCTNCERRIEVPLSQGDSNYDFCPNCGAKMKGADDEDA